MVEFFHIVPIKVVERIKPIVTIMFRVYRFIEKFTNHFVSLTHRQPTLTLSARVSLDRYDSDSHNSLIMSYHFNLNELGVVIDVIDMLEEPVDVIEKTFARPWTNDSIGLELNTYIVGTTTKCNERSDREFA
jgi:hypothetical protein